MDKCEREKTLLEEWAKENMHRYQFPQIDIANETYFMPVRDKNGIREYNISTLPDIREELESMWHDDIHMQDIIKIVGVAAMKNKPKDTVSNRQNGKNLDSTQEQLMPFIYNF